MGVEELSAEHASLPHVGPAKERRTAGAKGKAERRIRPLSLLADLGLPWIPRGDALYLWATYRLRRHPMKIVLGLASLAAVCWAWQWAGDRWVQSWLERQISMLNLPGLERVLWRATRPFLSSLNIASCLSILAMAYSVRRLAAYRQLDLLQLVPSKLRPSALFYALCFRYLPLAWVAVLIMYLDPVWSPFQYPPFAVSSGSAEVTEATIAWAGAHQLALLVFCPANLFMDLAVAYWLLFRLRANVPVAVAAMILMGLVSPIALVSFYDAIDLWVGDAIRQSDNGLWTWIRAGVGFPDRWTLNHIQATFHYGIGALGCALLGLGALADLNFRWFRMRKSTKRDPVFVRTVW